MKQCPVCKRQYRDDSLNFCLEDGEWLVADTDSAPTAILTDELQVEAPTRHQQISVSDPELAKTTEKTSLLDREPAGVFKKRDRRSPVLIAAVLIGAVALLGSAYWFFASQNDRQAPPSVARTAQVTSWSGLDLFPTISRDGKMLAFSSDRSGSFEIYLKQLVAGAREVQVTSDGNQNLQPSISPDGSFIAFHSKKRDGIWIIPSTGGTARQLSSFGSAPSFSPDGTQVAFQSDPLNDLSSNVRNALPPSTIWIVPVNGGEPKQVTTKGDPPGGHGHPSWSPDGNRLVFDVSDFASSRVACVDLKTSAVDLVAVDSALISDPVFSADGSFVYFSANMNTTIQRISLGGNCNANGKPENLFDSSGPRIRQMAVDGSGKRIAYSSLTTTSNIWSTHLNASGASEPQQVTHAALTRTIYPTFSPDGTRIAFQKFSAGNISHIWLINTDGSNETQIGTRSAICPTWSRDGKRITFISEEGDFTSMWYITHDGATEKKLFDFSEDVFIAKPSPDGKWVAYPSKQSGTTNVFLRSTEGNDVRQLTFDEEFAGFPAWSPDGRSLAVQLKRGEDSFIAVIAAEGGPIRQLTSDAGQSWVSDWSADGDEIVFAGQRDGLWNLYAVSVTTGKQRKLTNFTKLNTYVRYPVRARANDQIAFEYAETTGNIWMVEFK